MSFAKKSENAWVVCKVVEEDDDGKLHILEDNLKHLLNLIKKPKCDQVPIIFASFLGSTPSDVTLFTNLFISYVACNGQGWSSKIKKEGLKGFGIRAPLKSQLANDSTSDKDLAIKNEYEELSRKIIDQNFDKNEKSREMGRILTRSSKGIKNKNETATIEQIPATNDASTIYKLVDEILKIEMNSTNLTKEEKEAFKVLNDAAKKVKGVKKPIESCNISTTNSKADKIEEIEAGVSRGRKERKNRTRSVIKDDSHDSETSTTPDNSEAESAKKVHKERKKKPATKLTSSSKPVTRAPTSNDIDTQSVHEHVPDANQQNKTINYNPEPAILTSKLDTTTKNAYGVNHECTPSNKDDAPLLVEISITKNEENSENISRNEKRESQDVGAEIFSDWEDLSNDTSHLQRALSETENEPDLAPNNDQDDKLEIQANSNDNAVHETGDQDTLEKKLENRDDSEGKYKTLPSAEDHENVGKKQSVDESVNQNDKDCNIRQDTGTYKKGPSEHDGDSAKSDQTDSSKNCLGDAQRCLLENDIFYPDDAKSGIYFWPEIFKLDCCNGPKLLVVIYAHPKLGTKFEGGQHPISMLTATICSRIADLKGQNLSVYESLKESVSTDTKYSLLQNDLSTDVVKILRQENTSESENLSSKEFVMLDDLTNHSNPETDANFNLTPKQFRALSNISVSLLDECDLVSKVLDDGKTELNTNTIKRFMQQAVDKVNACNGFESTRSRPDSPQKPGSRDRYKRSVSPDEPPRKLVPLDNSATKLVSSSNQSQDGTANTTQQLPREPAPIVQTADPIPSSPNPNSREPHNVIDDNLPAPKALTFTKVEITEEMIEFERTKFLELQMLQLKEILKVWIDGDLKVENVKEMHTLVYKNWHANSQSKKQQSRGVVKLRATKSAENILKKAGEINQEFLKEVGTGIHLFDLEAQVILTKHECILPEDLKQKLEQLSKNIVKAKKGSDEASPFIEQGCTKLIIHYMDCNKENIQTEKMVAIETIPHLIKLYSEYFTNILCEKDFTSPWDVRSLHMSIFKELRILYKNTFPDSVIFTEEMKNAEALLVKTCEELFSKYISRLNLAQTKIKGLIKTHKDEYYRQMDILLSSNPNGMDDELFDKNHNQLLKVAEQSLKSDALNEISEWEPTENHEIALQKHIEKLYNSFSDENRINFKKYRESNGEAESEVIADITTAAKAADKLVTLKPETDVGSSISKQQIGSVIAENKTIDKPAFDKKTDSTRKPKSQPQPMIVQMALQRIRVCFPTTTTGMDQESISHPSQVGLSCEGKWVCGEEVQNTLKDKHPSYFHKVWDLETCLTIPQWQDQLSMEGNPFVVTAEFLLAIFFRFFKEIIELDTEGQVTTALVVVPFWFSSNQRLLISDAVYLAGFEQVNLVNENSAAAFHAYASKLIDPRYEAVVITENSHKVDISIYSCDSQIKRIALRGHAGDYEFQDVANSAGSGIIGTILSVFWSQPDTGEVENKALQKLKDIWQHALKVLQHHHPTSGSKSRPVHVSCQSEASSTLLYNFARSIVPQDNYITVCNESPILGMPGIHTATANHTWLRSSENLIREGMPFNITVHTPLSTNLVTVKKIDTLAITGHRLHVCTLPCVAGDFHFYQENLMGKSTIGLFKLCSLPTGSLPNGMEVTFQRTHDGILMMEGKISYSKKSTWGKASKETLSRIKYQWYPVKLSPAIKQQYQELFKQITPLQSDVGNIQDEINEVVQIGDLIKRAVMESKVTFKSTLAKEFFLSQIEQVKDFLHQPNIQVNELHQKREILTTLAFDYKIKIN